MRNNMRAIAILVALIATGSASKAQDLKIKSLSASPFSKQNLCASLGGAGAPPTFTVRHSKGAGSITVSMQDRLNNGNTVNHGSTTVDANPSGVTVVTHSFLAPCNRRTAQGLKSAYYVTATAGHSSKTILWSRYPR